VTRYVDFFPDWRKGNPFLSMLFSRLDDVDASARPTGPLTEHLERAASSGSPGLLNLHWTTPVLRGASDAGEAERRVGRLGELLDGFTAAGGRLVWTVHNVLPHDAVYPEAEVEVCRLVAEHADLVHVLSEETLPAVAPYYRLDPERVVTIPHSSYVGVYPQRIGRPRARRRLGLGAHDRVLATLGLIRPYKGIDRLLDAVARPPLDRPDLRLLVAGPQGGGPGMQALVERLASTPRVVSRAERVPDRDVQLWLGAADLAVLPYAGILNSGSFLLAETFGLPVVAPRAGALLAREGSPHVRLFDPDDFEYVLATALTDLVDDRPAAALARASALATAAANPPELMARRFAEVVGPLLGPGADGSSR
jgi:glycosyltransferase involved in cell wall biosynthesis